MRVATLDLRYCTEWRRWLWTEPIRWVLGDIARFRDKRVLDIGCRFGKMSCYFASLGAFVDGVDVFETYLDVARSEASRWGLSRFVNFFTYSGKLAELAGGYDFVFTKSTLVIMGDVSAHAAEISSLLKPNGEYLAVENLSGSPLVALARKHVLSHWQAYDKFHGLDESSIEKIGEVFCTLDYRKSFGLVVGIRAKWPKEIAGKRSRTLYKAG